MIDFTGERFVPGQVMSCIHYEHVHRYLFALPMMNGQRVLDIGCGEGYGTALLARRARLAVGVDVAPEAVRHAQGAYGRAGLDFVAGDARRLSFPDASFDRIVCFETLEHVPDGERILDEAARLLAPAGLFVVSSPNKTFYHRHDEAAGANPYHAKEWEAEEFERLVATRFRSHRIFGQHLALGSFIWEASRTEAPLQVAVSEGLDVPNEPARRETRPDPVYSIAVCSNDERLPLAESLSSLLLDNQQQVVRALEAHVNDMVREMGLKEAHVQDMMKHMKARDLTISELEARVKRLEGLVERPVHLLRQKALRALRKLWP